LSIDQGAGFGTAPYHGHAGGSLEGQSCLRHASQSAENERGEKESGLSEHLERIGWGVWSKREVRKRVAERAQRAVGGRGGEEREEWSEEIRENIRRCYEGNVHQGPLASGSPFWDVPRDFGPFFD
jgi:hypothetical protein